MRIASLVVAALAATVASAEATKPKVKAKPDAKPETKAKPKPKPKPEPEVKVDDLGGLTNDPVVGRADRIDGSEARHLVAFTFDDGPNPETTPAVIDALEKYDVPATFFVVTRRLVGNLGAKSRELLARQLAAGFLVASHSVSHPDLKGASASKLTAEIDVSIRTLAKEAGRPIGLFRAPFGSLDGNGRMWLKKRGLTEARWSVDTLDWKARDPQRLRAKVVSMIVKQEGGVVLMHDVKPITAQVIAQILDDLEAENCQRLADKREPIIPVSIHYFLRDKKQPREVPAAVKKRTEAYRAALPGRCATRPKVAVTSPK